MKFQIKHRWTDAVLFECELSEDIAKQPLSAQLGYAVKEVLKSDADLSGADLSDAYLSDAYLSGADLRGAYLSDAYLRGADLSDADLRDADLRDADLRDADLRGAENVPETNGPTSAERIERQRARAERFRGRHPEVPVIADLDRKILEAVTIGAGHLDMSTWHKCETTHCRAGWAITLAGAAGKELEAKHGPHYAGVQLYRASTGRVPNFYAGDEAAMDDIRRCAEESAQP
jgi:hypothetical protein